MACVKIFAGDLVNGVAIVSYRLSEDARCIAVDSLVGVLLAHAEGRVVSTISSVCGCLSRRIISSSIIGGSPTPASMVVLAPFGHPKYDFRLVFIVALHFILLGKGRLALFEVVNIALFPGVPLIFSEHVARSLAEVGISVEL